MNKQHLVDIIQNPAIISLRDLEALEELTELYPYFQIAHILVAKCHHDRQTVMADEHLHNAAVRATDRLVLKEFIDKDFSGQTHFLEDTETPAPKAEEFAISTDPEEKPEHFFVETPEQTGSIEQKDISDADDDLYNEIAENIRQLQSVKEKLGLLQTPDEDEQDKVSSENENREDDQIEEEKNLETLEYIEEIAKREVKDISEVQKEQQQIIDHFILNAPKMQRVSNPQSLNDYQEDLSKKFSEIDNDLLTENLASIMAKQGKTEKAIEIYQKLIWKFPEKKAYFVSCIENLKNQ